MIKKISNLNSASVEEKERVANELLNFIGKKSKKGRDLVLSINNKKEFRKPSFITHLHFIPIGQNKKDTSQVMEFLKPPMLGFGHKRLPLIIGITQKIPKSRTEKIKVTSNAFEVKQNLSWVYAHSRMTPKQKQHLVDLIIKGIEAQRKSKGPNKRWLSDLIRSQDEFKVIGLAVNIPYFNLDQKWGDTDVLWIHPWGTPQILLRHKELPIIIIVGPSIRLNENIFGDKNMEGYTG